MVNDEDKLQQLREEISTANARDLEIKVLREMKSGFSGVGSTLTQIQTSIVAIQGEVKLIHNELGDLKKLETRVEKIDDRVATLERDRIEALGRQTVHRRLWAGVTVVLSLITAVLGALFGSSGSGGTSGSP